MKTTKPIVSPKISITIFVVLFGGFVLDIALILFCFHSSYQKVVGEKPLPARPDFTSYAMVAEKKADFFTYIGELADRENQRILNDRAIFVSIQHRLNVRGNVNRRQAKQLEKLCAEYKVDAEQSLEEKLNALARRVNIIPRALVQVQAAIESGWGTSRFAIEGHNLFGQWCFAKGCGIVPANRAPGKTHEVARFASDFDAIRAYMRNLNTFRAYEGFRTARAAMQQEALPVSGRELARSLIKYSERGAEYVAEVQHMIAREKLEP